MRRRSVLVSMASLAALAPAWAQGVALPNSDAVADLLTEGKAITLFDLATHHSGLPATPIMPAPIR